MKSSRKPAARRRSTIGVNPLDAVTETPVPAVAEPPAPRRRRGRGVGALIGGLLVGLAFFCFLVL